MLRLFGTQEQYEVLTCPYRYIGMFAGRRFGKNYGLRNRHILKVLSSINFNYLFCSPNYSQGISEFDKLTSHPALGNLIKKANKGHPYPYIRWINGSISVFRSLDKPENLRGGEWNEICIDEVQNVEENVFYSIIEPMVSSTFGNIVVSGQFAGENWIYDRFFRQANEIIYRGEYPEKFVNNEPEINRDEDTVCYIFPTSQGVVFKSDKGKRELERLKKSIPLSVYHQEYECFITNGQRNVFSNIDECVVSGKYININPSGSYVAGLDLGQLEDHSALTVFDCNSQTFVYSKKFPLKIPHEKIAQEAGRILAGFGNPTCVMDSTGGAIGGKKGIYQHDEFTKEYKKHIPSVKPYYWSQSNKNGMVNNFSLALEQCGIKIDEQNKELIKQLRTYEYKRNKISGQYTYQGPSGKNDDLVASALMAYEGYNRNWYSSGDNTGAINNLQNMIGV